MSSPSDPSQIISQHHWWHTIDLGHQLVTPGAWDIRHLPARIPWPDSLAGKRCLDVGTMDGFWAFEMERRGAAEVLAIDVGYSETDHRVHRRLLRLRAATHAKRERSAAQSKEPPRSAQDASSINGISPIQSGEQRRPGETFNALAELLGSRATFRELNIYDLRPEDVGKFDLVFVGYMLHQLRDPLRALEAVREVCRGSVIVLDQILFFRSLFSRVPLAQFGARRDFDEWFYFNAAGLQRVVEFAGFRVAAVSPFLYYRRGQGVKLSELSLGTILKYTFGGAACSLAVRGERI